MDNECRPKIILFDLDGTIIDTMKEYAELAATIVSKRMKIDRDRIKQLYLKTAGRSFRDQLRLMNIPEDFIEDIAVEFEKAKIHLLAKVAPDEKVFERINKLRKAGLKTALSTNNECNVIKNIEWLVELFDIILCNDPLRSLEKGEPHFRQLLKMGYKKCEIIFVGDSDYDLHIYKQLGVESLRTKGLWIGEDKTLDTILDILSGSGSMFKRREYES